MAEARRIGLMRVRTPPPTAFRFDYSRPSDGQKFLFDSLVDNDTSPALTVGANWTALLKQ
jgi:hypothetical protein